MSGQEAGVTRLVLCDAHDAAWIAEAVAAAPDDQWDVLLVGVSSVAYRQRFARELGRLPRLTVLDPAAFAPAAHDAVSAFVLDLVFRLPDVMLGGRTLAQRLQQEDTNLWWSLKLTEKSSFRGPLVERLFRLALLNAALGTREYSELWLCVADDALVATATRGERVPKVRAFLRATRRTLTQRVAANFAAAYWARALAAAAGLARTRAVMRLAGWRIPRPARGSLGLLTMYPYWWLRPYEEDAADRFFSAPPESRSPFYAAWLMFPGRLWAQRHAVARTFERKRIVPLQAFLGFGDALALLNPARFRRLAAVHSRLTEIRERFLRFDVSALVHDELRASLSDAEIAFDALLGRAVQRMVRRINPSIVAYRVEGQPWESAVVQAAGAEGTVGFFHSPFGRNYAPLRFAAGDITGGSGAGPRPMPSGMLVCGSVSARYLAEDGFPPHRIAACGPQRHASFVRFLAGTPSRERLRQKLTLPLGVPVYFVALAIVEVETEGLFASIAEALAGREGFFLAVKTHPNRPEGDAAMQAALASVGPGRSAILPAAADMYEHIAASDAMITIGSTVAFEAMALGVMPVVYEHPGTYAATSLRAFQSSLFVVNSPRSLGQALAAIDAGSPEAVRRREQWPATVRGVFGDLTAPLSIQMDAALRQLSGGGDQ